MRPLRAPRTISLPSRSRATTGDKPYLRLTVAGLMLDALKGMELEWPKPSKDEMKEMKRLQKELMSDE